MGKIAPEFLYQIGQPLLDGRTQIERARAIHEQLFVRDRLLPEARLRERAKERLLRLEIQLRDAVEPPGSEPRARGGAPRRRGIDVELHVAEHARRDEAEARVLGAVVLEVRVVRER